MSHKLRKIISPLLYATGAYQRAWRRHAEARGGMNAVICYHRIVEDNGRRSAGDTVGDGVPVKTFEAQIRFMLRHFAPVTASEAANAANGRACFAVTFDDGYVDNFTIAAPILRRLGVPAAFYVVSEYVGTTRRFWWDRLAEIIDSTYEPSVACADILPEHALREPPEQLSLESDVARHSATSRLEAALRGCAPGEVEASLHRLAERLGEPTRSPSADDRLMSWDELRTLARQGFEIGGHSADHYNLAHLSPEELTRQVNGCKARLEREIRQPVKTFAYPYGGPQNYSAAVMQSVRGAGYAAAFTGVSGVVTPGADPTELPRLYLNWPWQFACAHNVQTALRETA